MESARTGLWETALREALEVISAYLVPSGYAFGEAALFDTTSGLGLFSEDVYRRIDLWRSRQVLRMLPLLARSATAHYHHRLVTSAGTINGKLHLPRYLQMKALGRGDLVPVLRASLENSTPENLLVAEAIEIAIRTSRLWAQRARGHGEGGVAEELLKELVVAEQGPPWNELRRLPRPAVRTLCNSVLARGDAGVLPKGSSFVVLARLLLAPTNYAGALQEACRDLGVLIANDDTYEDRVFELLCLAWVLLGLRDVGFVMQAKDRLQGSGRSAVVEGRLGTRTCRVFFQSATSLPEGTWRLRRSARLRALPDIVVECDSGHNQVVIDAKNRSAGSETDVLYKLLGYKENLHFERYMASAIFPGYSNVLSVKRYEQGNNCVTLCRVPLGRGRALFRRTIRIVMLSGSFG